MALFLWWVACATCHLPLRLVPTRLQLGSCCADAGFPPLQENTQWGQSASTSAGLSGHWHPEASTEPPTEHAIAYASIARGTSCATLRSHFGASGSSFD
eukprot:2471006-Amphidinium_carterae.2